MPLMAKSVTRHNPTSLTQTEASGRRQTTETVSKLYHGKLRLERRNGGRTIYARTFQQGKLVTKSTGETTIGAATKVATDWYLDLLQRVRFGEHLHGPTFNKALVEKFIDHKRRRHGTSEGQCQNFRDKWNLLKSHLDGVNLAAIDAQWLEDFRVTRSHSKTRYGVPIKPATLKKDLDFIRGVLRYAKEWEKSIAQLPEFPSFTGSKWTILKSPRPFFDKDDFKRLLKVARSRMREPDLNPRTREQRQMLYYFILIAVGAALRVEEAESLRWCDCRIAVLGDKDKTNVLYLKVLGKHSKGGEREEGYGTPLALAAYYRLSILQKKTDANPEEKIFTEHYRDGMRELLITARLRTDENGKTRDLKSLRPTGISLRLDESENPNYRDIAKWARTSPKMIADFYDQTHPHDSVTRIMGRKQRV